LDKPENDFEFTEEIVDEIIKANFGMPAKEYFALSFEEQVAISIASGRPYACTANVAPKDQDGNPVTEGGFVSPVRH
jgi:uncharacterized protein YwqG